MIHYRYINFFSHLRNLQGLLISLVLLFLISYIFFLTDANISVFLFFGIFGLIYAILTILVHWNYFKNDSGKSLVVNDFSIEITDNDNNKTIVNSCDVIRVLLTTGLKGKGTAPWSDYFFLQIELKDKEPIFLTSLLIPKKIFPFPIESVRNTVLPFVKYYSYEIEIIERKTKIIEEERYQIDKFKQSYSDYSINELKYILENKSQYQSSAVSAATELLREKITVANSGS